MPGKAQLGHQEEFLHGKVVKYWQGLLREVQSPHPWRVSQEFLDVELRSLGWDKVGIRHRVDSLASEYSSFNNSVIFDSHILQGAAPNLLKRVQKHLWCREKGFQGSLLKFKVSPFVPGTWISS